MHTYIQNVLLYMYKPLSIYIYMFIYIYRVRERDTERERVRERERERERQSHIEVIFQEHVHWEHDRLVRLRCLRRPMQMQHFGTSCPILALEAIGAELQRRRHATDLYRIYLHAKVLPQPRSCRAFWYLPGTWTWNRTLESWKDGPLSRRSRPGWASNVHSPKLFRVLSGWTLEPQLQVLLAASL